MRTWSLQCDRSANRTPSGRHLRHIGHWFSLPALINSGARSKRVTLVRAGVA